MKPFTFYGRVSTEDQQDPASSRAWQLRRALELIEPAGGAVVEEFFVSGSPDPSPRSVGPRPPGSSSSCPSPTEASRPWPSANRSVPSTAHSSP